MIGQKLEHWLWKGTVEPAVERMEIWGDLELHGDSLLGQMNSEVRRLVAELDHTREVYEKRLAAEMTGKTALATSEKSIGRRDDGRDLVKTLLPSLDALDRIIQLGETHAAGDEVFGNWLTSVKALHLRLRKTMEGLGLVAISSIGMQVDLELHDVVAVVPATADYLPNTVVEEQQKGYYYKGKLLRDAKVVVAQ